MAAPVDKRNTGGIRSTGAFLRKFLELGENGRDGVFARMWSQKGASLSIEVLEEEITLATGGTTTETTFQIPADAIVLAVMTRITTTITTAVNYDVGVSGAATRYDTNNTNVTADDVNLHLDHWAGANIVSTGADEVLITTDVNPGAGAMRVTVFFIRAVGATS